MSADAPLEPLTDSEILWVAGLLQPGILAEPQRESEDAA